jgi:hypothetical protein
MNEIVSVEVILKSRPRGLPTLDNFDFRKVKITDIKEDEILVKNLFMSVDPYMRGRMNNIKTYVEPFQVGEPLSGDAVGIVMTSKTDKVKEGDYVVTNQGFREYFVADSYNFDKINLEVIKPIDGISLSAYLGVLGMPGLTAYAGLLRVGALKEGDEVFVSAAAGAVGSTVCQIAKIKNCYVIGTAGSNDKIEWLLKEAKIDGAFNYKEVKNYNRTLKEMFANGIDVYYENVGGKLLEAALNNMKKFGRIVLCGMISLYNSQTLEPGPSNLFKAIENRLRLEGFIVFDYRDLKPQFYKDMINWIISGKIKWRETVYNGILNSPQALIDLFSGKNLGKMIVKL